MCLAWNILLINLNIQQPLLSEIGAATFGGIVGYSAGYAIKKVFKIFLIVVGLLFASFQLLSHFDFLVVNWLKIQTFVNTLIQNNNNSNMISILTAHLPETGGFTAGLILGFKKG